MCLPPLEVSNDPKSSFSKTKSFPGRYESLARIGDFVREMAQEAGFESFAVYSIEMAVDEACSNIIEHAYGGEAAGEDITCTCKITEDDLIVELHDHGQAFDPADIPLPNVHAALHARETGGLGLYFMRQLMDEVLFSFSPGSKAKDGGKSRQGNHLILIKHKEPQRERHL